MKLGRVGRHGLVGSAGGTHSIYRLTALASRAEPAHIAAMAGAVKNVAPRVIHEHTGVTRLAGLDPFVMAA